MRKHTLSKEQRIAVKMAELIDGVALDLDRVGIEFARLQPKTHYNRLMIIAESAVEEQDKESQVDHDRYNQHSLF
jgi:hypothetical protein